MENIRIGTLVNGKDAVKVIPQILPYGFESFGITFWQTTGGIDLPETAKQIREVVDEKNVVISSLTVFGNVLTGEGGNSDTLASWERLIDNAHYFGTDLVTGFTGRLPDRPIPESIPKFKQIYGELAQRAADKGVRLAFENCNMGGSWYGGDWNIAHNPTAWELMFDALPMDHLGLQWEPCHQLVKFIDPIPQLRKWVKKIFSVHGKDATVAWDILREYGKDGHMQYAWDRTPGFGDSDWTNIISILRAGGYKGTIDIEGFHDPVYQGELEYTGQVHGLNYLKQCRGGDYVKNPEL